MPIVILVDGLYANQTFFKICQDNNWDFIVTFKDGSLPSVHQELELLPASAKSKNERFFTSKTGYSKQQFFQWCNDIEYCGFTLSVVQCNETKIQIKSGKRENRKCTIQYLWKNYGLSFLKLKLLRMTATNWLENGRNLGWYKEPA